jgi:hypothetical protein
MPYPVSILLNSYLTPFSHFRYLEFLGGHTGSLQPSCTLGRPNHPHPTRTVNYSTSLNDMRSLLDHLGYNGSEYSGHSSRRGVATRSAAVGIPEDEIQVAGGWNDPRSVRVYIDRQPEQSQRLTRRIFE